MPAGRAQQPLRVRRAERLDRLVGGEMPARLAVELAPQERRLADEEVDLARELRKALARARVARVREHLARVPHAQAVRLERVVRQPDRDHFEAGGAERLALAVELD